MQTLIHSHTHTHTHTHSLAHTHTHTLIHSHTHTLIQKKKDDEEGEEGNQQVPRIFVTFKVAHMYQLRAYIYQARDMYGSDKSGLSGIYVYTLAIVCSKVRYSSVC